MPDSLAHLTRRQPFRRPFDLSELIRQLQTDLLPQATARRQAIDIDAPEHLALTADQEQIQALLLHVAENLLSAAPPAAKLLLTVCGDSQTTEIEIACCGDLNTTQPILAEEFSGDDQGWRAARTIARAHRGELTHLPGPEGGAAITLRIETVTTQKIAA